MLKLYSVVRCPAVNPTQFVVKCWHIKQSRGIPMPVTDAISWSESPTIEKARESIPRGLICMSRSHSEDGSVIESWI